MNDRKIYNFYFSGAEKLENGIKLVEDDLFFKATEKCCADIVINVKNDDKIGLSVSLKGDTATITYGKRKSCFFRALMLLCQALYEGKTEFEKSELPHFDMNGCHVDLSRNNPLSIKGLEYFIRHNALMGHNSMHLYMEDMYEVPEYPHFGHQRGRYTMKQLKLLDDYAYELGIELIPYIQTLGHFEKYLKYHSTRDIRSTNNELLADDPKTYEFIENIIKAVSSCFRTKLINVGLDEPRTFVKGRYEAIHGKVDVADVYYRHLNIVADMAKKYGLKPYVSVDMYFQYCWKGAPPADGFYVKPMVEFDQKARENFPQGAILNYWDYSTEDEERMVTMFNKIRELSDDIFYLGGVKMYQSLIVKYQKSLATITAGVPAAIRANVKQMALSMWEDSGETPHFLALPALLLVAEYDYGVGYNEEELSKKVKFLYGVDFQAFVDMERADNVHDNDNLELASKFLLYNDPLFGLLDKNAEGLDLKAHYSKLVCDYDKVNPLPGPMDISFKQFKAMISVLELKADFGLRLKKAYDDNNRAMLQAMADEALVIADRIKHYMDVDKELYTSYYRGFGLDVVEQRRATIRSRFETTRYMILKYLSGEIDAIEELVNERRLFDYNPWECTCENIFFGESFNRIYSPNL